MTLDELAVRLMLENRYDLLERLAQKVTQPVACPVCGSRDVQDNGETDRRYLSYCCNGCGEHWDAVDV
jgi:transposase-like protein